jgi:FAD/FMN-containing dehydrogenase
VHISTENLQNLQRKITGELLFDSLHRRLYSTDASIYQQEPLAVAYPRTKADIKALINFAKTNGTSLIPRTAGTSLAGQCVGARHCGGCLQALYPHSGNQQRRRLGKS